MKYLVTGGAGAIGSNLVIALSELVGDQGMVIVLDNFDPHVKTVYLTKKQANVIKKIHQFVTGQRMTLSEATTQ